MGLDYESIGNGVLADRGPEGYLIGSHPSSTVFGRRRRELTLEELLIERWHRNLQRDDNLEISQPFNSRV